MKEQTTNIYERALEKLKNIKARQEKLIKKYSKILEKEKIEKLRQELQK